MDGTHPPSIYIVEGVSGAGKDTFCSAFLETLHPDINPIWYFPEELVGFHFNTVLWPGITEVRLSLMEQAMDFVEKELQETPETVFLFNRFHLSLIASLHRSRIPEDFDGRYAELVERLSRLNVLILVLQLARREIETKLHLERGKQFLVWKRFLKKRIEESPFDTAEEVFMDQQETMNRLAREQTIAYETGSLAEVLGMVQGLGRV